MKTRRSIFNLFIVAVLVAASVFYVSAQESDGIELDKRSLRDFGEKLKSDIASKRFDLSAPFLVEMRGILDKKGKLDPKATSFARTEGDPALVEAVKDAIFAINDAGYFEYIESLASKGFLLIVEQNASDFQARITMEFETPTRAQSIRSMTQLLLVISRDKKQGPDATEADKKDLVLLKGITVQSEDKNVVLFFKAPAAEIQKLIAEELIEKAKNGQ